MAARYSITEQIIDNIIHSNCQYRSHTQSFLSLDTLHRNPSGTPTVNKFWSRSSAKANNEGEQRIIEARKKSTHVSHLSGGKGQKYMRIAVRKLLCWDLVGQSEKINRPVYNHDVAWNEMCGNMADLKKSWTKSFNRRWKFRDIRNPLRSRCWCWSPTNIHGIIHMPWSEGWFVPIAV